MMVVCSGKNCSNITSCVSKIETITPILDRRKATHTATYLLNSNALANLSRHMIGYRHKYSTIYPAIYCCNLDIIM